MTIVSYSVTNYNYQISNIQPSSLCLARWLEFLLFFCSFNVRFIGVPKLVLIQTADTTQLLLMMMIFSFRQKVCRWCGQLSPPVAHLPLHEVLHPGGPHHHQHPRQAGQHGGREWVALILLFVCPPTLAWSIPSHNCVFSPEKYVNIYLLLIQHTVTTPQCFV